MSRWWRLAGWRLPLEARREDLPGLLAGELGLAPASLLDWRIIRQSLDARRKVGFVYTVEFQVEARAERGLQKRRPDLTPVAEERPEIGRAHV